MGELFFYWLTQGQRRTRIASHSSATWGSGGSGYASDLVPEMRDERRIEVVRPSYNFTLLGTSEDSKAHQGRKAHPRTNNASPVTGYGTGNSYGDESEASGYLQPAYATAFKMTDFEWLAMGEYGEGCTVPSTQELPRSLTSEVTDHETPGNLCACVSCLKMYSYAPSSYSRSGYKCRFLGCGISQIYIRDLQNHEKSHYGHSGKYTCLEQNCHVVTKNFGDLKRHYKVHCTKPDKEQFPCPVPWCKYSGNNGFARKDKLKSHYKNVHEGKAGPVQAGRIIMPATLKPQVPGFGGNAGKQKE